MRTVLVRYVTAPEHADANEALVRKVFEELRASSPTGLTYSTYRLADGVTFVHIATHQGDNQLARTPAFQAFQAGLKARCTEMPVLTEMSAVGSYTGGAA